MTAAPHRDDVAEPQERELPLSGIRVLDLSRALSGPFCTALLGDLGADIVKVESLEGESCRQWGPYQGTESLYFVAANRNKRSLSLDMWSPAGKKLLRDMVGSFDVIVENFRPGVLAALGLDPEWLQANHPHVVVTSISGFGHVGPRASEACYDQVAQGMGGLMSITGTEVTGPLRTGIPLADVLTGLFTAIGVCASLAGRTRGQAVNTSLLESVIGVLSFQGQRYLSLGEVPVPAGNFHPVTVPYGVMQTADQPINLAAGTGGQWVTLCDVLGVPELATDQRFATPPQRSANREELYVELHDVLVTRPAAEWLEALKAAHVPCGPVNNMQQTFEEPQVLALEMVEQVPHTSLGKVPIARGPLWLGGEPTHIRRAAPLLGEHSAEILDECGIDPDRVRSLIADGCVSALTAE